MANPPAFALTNSFGQTIADMETWPRPKAAYQWKAGRSAMELARC
jgi:hypothetical protein